MDTVMHRLLSLIAISYLYCSAVALRNEDSADGHTDSYQKPAAAAPDPYQNPVDSYPDTYQNPAPAHQDAYRAPIVNLQEPYQKPGASYQDSYRTSYKNASYNGYRSYQDCGLPNVGLPVKTIPERQHGYHYGYLVWPQKFVQTNPYFTIDRIGRTRTLFPGTDIEAEAQRVQWYNHVCLPNTPQCSCHAFFGPFTSSVDGRYSGFWYDSDKDNEFAPQNGFYLYDDCETVEINYECYYANKANGKCASPALFVNTRKRPDRLSSQEKARIDQIVDSVLSQYCFTRGQLYEHVWIPRPLCTDPAPPSCFAGAVKGIENSINNGRFVNGFIDIDVQAKVTL